MITEHNRLLCGGPLSSNLLLAVRIVAQFCGAAVAAQSAKAALIDGALTSLVNQDALRSTESCPDPIVSDAISWIWKHIADPIRIQDLTKVTNMSARSLIKRFNSALGLTPLAYIQSIRIRAAKRLLEETKLGIEDIGYNVGYSNVSSFTRLFRLRVGESPGAYRHRTQLNKSK